MEQIEHISPDLILPPSFDGRISTDEQADIELTESIRDMGIFLPLIVQKKDGKYEIIAGHRRFRCGGKVGLQTFPCLVKTASEEEIEKIKIHENIKRLPLSHIDQAITFRHLMDNYGLTEEKISIMIGKSIAYVSQHITLLESDPKLVDAVRDGKLNFSVARELMQIKSPEELTRLQKFAEDDGVTCVVARHWVDESNKETAKIAAADDTGNFPDPPPLSTQPGFKCPGCEQWHEIRELCIVRLCKSCNYLIFSAIEAQKRKQSAIAPTKTAETPS